MCRVERDKGVSEYDGLCGRRLNELLNPDRYERLRLCILPDPDTTKPIGLFEALRSLLPELVRRGIAVVFKVQGELADCLALASMLHDKAGHLSRRHNVYDPNWDAAFQDRRRLHDRATPPMIIPEFRSFEYRDGYHTSQMVFQADERSLEVMGDDPSLVRDLACTFVACGPEAVPRWMRTLAGIDAIDTALLAGTIFGDFNIDWDYLTLVIESSSAGWMHKALANAAKNSGFEAD